MNLEEEEIARNVRAFDEIVHRKCEPHTRSRVKALLFIVTIVIIIAVVVGVLYVKRNNLPFKLPFGKKEKISDVSTPTQESSTVTLEAAPSASTSN